jgi:hypothetical protein
MYVILNSSAMKMILIAGLILVAAPCSAQKNPQATIEKAFASIAELDIDKLKTCFTEDMILIEDGEIWNMDTLVSKILSRKKDDTFRRENKISIISTETDGNMAWACYHNEAKGISNGSPFIVKWLESAVLVKEGDLWKIKVLHSTRINTRL